MRTKFRQTSILILSLIFSLLIACFLLIFESFFDHESRKSKFLEAVETHYAGADNHFFRQLEFCLREGELPYYVSLVGEKMKNSLGLTSIKIFDDSLRLVYSDQPTKEIFQAELRHDNDPLMPARSRKLASGDNVYRSADGKFFIVYPKPYLPKPLLENPNLEYNFNYWVFDAEIGSINYTNDFSLLNNDRDAKEILNLFQDNEGKKISWRIGGEEGTLEKIVTKNYSIYIIDSLGLIPKWGYSHFVLVFFLTFITICLIRIGIVSWKGEFHYIARSKLIGIFLFIFMALFYQGTVSFLPDFRYHKPWVKLRFEQIEVMFQRLEKNIMDQIIFSQGEIKSRNTQYDTVVKEIYFWRPGESTSQLTNRFGLEMNYYLAATKVIKSSRMIESHFEYLFIIPIREREGDDLFAIVVLDPLLLAAKKEKDRDEFFFPDNFFSLSEDKSKEVFFLHPKAWDKALLTDARHTHLGLTSFSLFGIPFRIYYFSVLPGTPSATNGLFVYKSEGVFPILIYTSLFAFIPFFLFAILSSVRRPIIQKFVDEDEILVTPSSPQEEEVISEPISVPVAVSLPLSEVIKVEIKMEEAIAKEDIEVQMGEVTVKKHIHQYVPPILWRKASLALPPEIQKKRDSIFNFELKSLVDQVTTVEPGFGRRKSDLKNESSIWPIPEEKKFEYALLDRVYRGDGISWDGIVEYTRNFIARLGSPRFSFLFLNDTIGSYHSQISFGLDYNTRSNLIFLHKDPFLKFDDFGFATVDVDEHVRLDKFIAKKFSWEILAQIETVIALNLEVLGFPGIFLILLNKQEKEKFLEPHKRMIIEKIKQIVPALHVLMEKEDKTPDLFEDSLSWIVRSFLQATLGGKRTAYITHVIWEDFHPTDANEAKKAKLLAEVIEITESIDRVIEDSPNTFIIVSEKELGPRLEKILKTYPFPYEIQYMKYPDDGENYYLYL